MLRYSFEINKVKGRKGVAGEIYLQSKVPYLRTEHNLVVYHIVQLEKKSKKNNI